MKINEIIEPQEIDRPVSTPFNIRTMGSDMPDMSLGGAYANGVEDPTDPHMYRKKTRMPSVLEDDAYLQYIKACAPYMKSNPYFPRVYKVIFKKFKNGYVKPFYQIEKLLHLDSAIYQIGATDLVDSLADKIFTEEFLSNRASELNMYQIITTISRSTSYELEPIFKDENLIQAMELIKKVKKSNIHFSIDMHMGNFMIRLGTTGPQLVMTDPLADGGISIAAGYSPFTARVIDKDKKEEKPF